MTTPRPIAKVIGYVRVSTGDQDVEAQIKAIQAKADAKGWEIVDWRKDVASGKSMRRPMLQAALADLKARKADALCVAKLDRLSRSVPDFGIILEQARAQGWHVVMLDLELDTSTPMGEAMANMAMTFAQFERRMIGLRTKEALAIKREHGIIGGRKRMIDKHLEARIRSMSVRGHSMHEIARRLNAEGAKAPMGGDFGWTTIARVVKRT